MRVQASDDAPQLATSDLLFNDDATEDEQDSTAETQLDITTENTTENETTVVAPSSVSDDVHNNSQSTTPLAETTSNGSIVDIDIRSNQTPDITINGQPITSDVNSSSPSITHNEGNTSFNISINQSGGEEKSRTRQKIRIDTESTFDRDMKEDVDIRIRE